MTDDEIEEAAVELVMDHLGQGVEYLTVSEALSEENEDVSNDDTDAVFQLANNILVKISNLYFEDAD